ncbi:MAG TPA: mechanosensitive ion channel domain-containing protein [Chitinophagaceae bacterium]|nr:mechanosensitive ion channel domain-containing protein [Chitinophagaceae bacterium]
MDIKNERQLATEAHVPSAADTKKHKLWIGTYLILGGACIIAYFLFRLQVLHVLSGYRELIMKLCLAALSSLTVLVLAKITELFISRRHNARAIKYNVVKVVRLLSILIIILIVISFLNANWYTAAASLGLVSLILGFALQTPISSLIGWFYIVFRVPYKVGDRIQVGDFTGDVVEINYLDTTLWEFAGTYMTNDLPSGRLIRFPNSMVFQYQVYNYSWSKFPYIWNEIPFHVAYDSDLVFVEATVREIAKQELGVEMEERVEDFRRLIQQTPVDELEIKEYPFVNLRINANTWVEVLLIYLVEPKQASAMRSRLIKNVLTALLQQPDKVRFPKGDSR